MTALNPNATSLFNPLAVAAMALYALFYLAIAVGTKFLFLHNINLFFQLFIIGFFTAVAISLASVLRPAVHNWGVRIANRQCERLVKRVYDSSTIKPPYILYLRPHWLDDNPSFKNPYYSGNAFLPSFWLHRQLVSFDHVLSLKLGLPVAALGTQRMRLSTGSITVPDKDWMHLASTLMRHAVAILIIPGTTPGLRWELDEIENHSFSSKTIIIQPPEVVWRQGQEATVELHWQKMREHESRPNMSPFLPIGQVTCYGNPPSLEATKYAFAMQELFTQMTGESEGRNVERSAGNLTEDAYRYIYFGKLPGTDHRS